MAVQPGWNSLYAIPGEREWRIVVNGEARRWGIPIGDEVREKDVGSGTVPVESTAEVVELMMIRFEARSDSVADMVPEWDRRCVRVPIVLVQPRPQGDR